MPGPVPKMPEARARNNKPAFGEWREVSIPDPPVLPELPELPGDAWSSRTARLWAGLRQDPATSLFGEAEIALAIEAAFVYEHAVRGKTNASQTGQALKWLDTLGLTPKGKRDLRLRVVDAEPVTKLASVKTPNFKRKAV